MTEILIAIGVIVLLVMLSAGAGPHDDDHP